MSGNLWYYEKNKMKDIKTTPALKSLIFVGSNFPASSVCLFSVVLNSHKCDFRKSVINSLKMHDNFKFAWQYQQKNWKN